VSEEYKDRILDAFLEETLGGHYPPDLTAKILQTWNARHTHSAMDAELEPLALGAPLAEDELPAPPIQRDAASPTAYAEVDMPLPSSARRRRRSRVPWWGLALAGGSLAASIALALVVLRRMEQPSATAVVREQPPPSLRGGGARPSDPKPPSSLDRRVPGPSPQLVGSPSHWPRPEPLQTAPQVAATTDDHKAVTTPPQRKLKSPSPDAEVIAFVDDVLRQVWRERGVTPSPPASDAEWCRRVYDRLVGHEPSKEELLRFTRDPGRDRRQRLVDQLLADDEYARHWADFWTAALLGPAIATGPSEAAQRQGLRDYLFAAGQTNKPHDQLVSELLTASGTSRPGDADYNAAVHFLVSTASPEAIVATDRTARAFLGQQLVCVRCHDHRANSWEQRRFWELNAFFRQMHVRRAVGTDLVCLTDADFCGETGIAKDAEIFYKQPDGRLKAAYPALNEQRLPHSGLVSDVSRRRELARFIVAADEFPRATVNRLWEKLLGYGIVQPVDDLGPHNPPAHPQLLERLSDEFAAHRFDLKGLARWIVLSTPFGLSDRRMPESWMDAPEQGALPLFARYYPPREATRDVYKALMVAVNARNWAPRRGSGTVGTLARQMLPTTTGLEIIDVQPSDRVAGAPWLNRLAASSLRPEQKVEHLFLSALGRKPSPRESTAAKLLLADRLNDAVALPEIWRTLLATGETGSR
jgi:hypothetical protein